MNTLHYRGYHIRHDFTAKPALRSPVTYAHQDYDGAPDSNDHRCGLAKTLPEAIRDIDELEEA